MIRPSTPAEIEEFFGVVGIPVRMVTMDIDGQALGVAGLACSQRGVFALSHIKPQAKAYPKEILRGAHIVQAMCEEAECDVFAEPDPDESNSSGLLMHLGFEPLYGGEYVYRFAPR